jgi:quinolinate synthase
MADMADLDEVEEAWEALAATTDIKRVIPITYMNSSAALKAFVGRNGGAVCTSTNARAILDWALGKGLRAGRESVGATGGGDKVLFFPDQHLGRNTGLQMGYGHEDMRVWNPRLERGGLTEADIKDSTLLLWKGHCSVHQRFKPEHITQFRTEHPDGIVVMHPECSFEVCQMADHVGSTDFIIRTVNEAPVGSVIGVGTEIHLVNRLNDETPDKTVVTLDPLVCPCSTMFRIDAPHLCWVLENLVNGVVVNKITVDADTTEWARVALQRMLEIV